MHNVHNYQNINKLTTLTAKSAVCVELCKFAFENFASFELI